MSADVWRVEFSTVDGLPPRKIRVTCADVAQWDYIDVHEAMRRTDEAVAAALAQYPPTNERNNP